MKKTQMIHSPRTFKLGLGLILAASLVSMPVLTGAGERDGTKAKTKTKASTSKQLETAGKAISKKGKETTTKAAEKRRQASSKQKREAEQGRIVSAEDRARARVLKLQSEAKKLASKLTPTQKTKLLALLIDAKSTELTRIDGIGKSRSDAIEKARPIKSVEDLQKVKGVGIKTFAEVVDHGKTLTRSRSKSKAKSASATTAKKKKT